MRVSAAIGVLALVACGGARVVEPTPPPAPSASSVVAPAPELTSDPIPAEAVDAGAPDAVPDDELAVPAPAAPERPSVAVVALPDGDVRVAGPLTEHARAHAINLVRRDHHARALIADAIQVSAPDGSSRAWVLYAYSLWEACVYADGGESTRERRQACSERIAETGYGEQSSALRACNAYGLLRMDFAPPDAAGEVHGDVGSHDIFLDEHGCQLETLHELALRDADLDGHAEIVVDVQFTWPDFFVRGSGGVNPDAHHRSWHVLREEDLSVEAEITRWSYIVSANEGYPFETNASYATFALRDETGDGRPDLVVDGFAYTAPCAVDADGAPTTPTGDARRCEPHDRYHRVWRYARGRDRWVDPAASH